MSGLLLEYRLGLFKVKCLRQFFSLKKTKVIICRWFISLICVCYHFCIVLQTDVYQHLCSKDPIVLKQPHCDPLKDDVTVLPYVVSEDEESFRSLVKRVISKATANSV